MRIYMRVYVCGLFCLLFRLAYSIFRFTEFFLCRTHSAIEPLHWIFNLLLYFSFPQFPFGLFNFWWNFTFFPAISRAFTIAYRSIFMITMVKSLSNNSSILFILVLSSDVFSHLSCDFSFFCYGKWFSNVPWKFSLLFWDILGPNEVFCFISHPYHVCCRLWFSLSYILFSGLSCSSRPTFCGL